MSLLQINNLDVTNDGRKRYFSDQQLIYINSDAISSIIPVKDGEVFDIVRDGKFIYSGDKYYKIICTNNNCLYTDQKSLDLILRKCD